MARVAHRKAAKDYPEIGVKKGDMYYYTKIKTGPRSSRVMRSKTPFRPSQLTSSAFKSALYDWEEQLASCGHMQDVQELVDSLREIGEQEREKYDNMPEGLQQGDTGQMLEQRADACDEAADELEDVISRWESDGSPGLDGAKDADEEAEETSEDDEGDEDSDDPQEKHDEYLSEAKDVCVSCD